MIEAIAHLKQSIANGKHWYIAILESIALWGPPEEFHCERHYRYLIEEQAFDWLLLAERLCEEIAHFIPEEERVALLFGTPPFELTNEEFEVLIGKEKYMAHLNYFYGIVAEEALQLAIEMEIEKEQHSIACLCDAQDPFQRIYGNSEFALLHRFREEKGYSQNESIIISELKEFTYWLFKYRIETCDPTRVASDTKKALDQLAKLQDARRELNESDGYGD